MVNRGFAAYHDRLFMVTLDAHFVALEMKTGKVIYDIEMAAVKDGFAATGAPLVVKDKVIVGVAGGEFANRGFIDAYDPMTGQRAWRFYTIPAPGEPGSDSWKGEIWQRGGGPTWLTGTYDPQLNLLYWGVGNPNPDWDGESRPGDNLYTGSLVALDPDTGTLKWHYQFTPHDTHDWDANEVPVLADLTIGGRPRKVVMMANRNGFFYVLDRDHGRLSGREAVREHDVGAGARLGRKPLVLAGPGSDAGRHGHVSGLVRRHELHVAVVRRVPDIVLRHGARDVRALHPAAGDDVRRGRPHDGWHGADGDGAETRRRAARDRPDDGRAQVGDHVRRRGLGGRPRHRRRRRLQRRSPRGLLRGRLRTRAPSSSSSRPARRFSRRRPATRSTAGSTW